ncbi:MAG TPA: UDP-N-acetylmuramoyl-L-alanyl-D-glutamate--2,6-diaminopimelate ligase [Anaeromyxobacteraceae bacterium]|nr:UDP-N-acetylmuramoyl-L-alanyl-D-glutamate--2,6-diaminopimelate ligase [Anaeromyxobacteraceae bacterium]
MRLSSVIAGTGAAGDLGADPDVQQVTCDSRAVRPGALFCAVRGVQSDGHDFAAAAARAGAAAVLAERVVDCEPARLLLAPDSRYAMAIAAANFHGRPAESLTLVGVTGTNGKTTVAYLVEACARAAAIPVGILGTVTWRWPGFEREASHTTPESTELQAMLAAMRDSGTRVACLEVSSHALAQHRVAGLRFRAAGFTNLTRDHLDYHGDEEHYLAEKRKLFTEHLRADGVAVVNEEDAAGARLARELRDRGATVWGTGRSARREVSATAATIGLAGISAHVTTPAGAFELRSPLVGAHNLENLLTATGLALAAGIPLDAVARGLASSPGAPGRLERVEQGGVAVFVDYAHTPDALERALTALRALSPRRLIAVFGCGGDRDRGKRPLMGAAAARLADLVVVTSDNPRTEDAAAIIADILPGVDGAGLGRLDGAGARAGAAGYVVVPERREAIDLAVAAARPGDAILLAGKGHETYQIVGKEKRHFDDREEARRALGIP